MKIIKKKIFNSKKMLTGMITKTCGKIKSNFL